MNAADMKYATLPTTEEYVAVEMNAGPSVSVQYVPHTMTAGECAPAQRPTGCWACATDPRPELRQLKTAFWVFMGGFALPQLVMMVMWLTLGLVALFGRQSYRAERDAYLGFFIWLYLLWMATMALVLATVGCALYGSIRVFLLAKQFSAANWLAIVQLSVCCLLAFMTLVDDFFNLSFFLPAYLVFVIFSLVYTACVASFWRCVIVLQRELDAMLPLTAPCHPAVAVPAVETPSVVDFKGSF